MSKPERTFRLIVDGKARRARGDTFYFARAALAVRLGCDPLTIRLDTREAT